MNAEAPLIINITYDADRLRGMLALDSPTSSATWDRIRQSATAATDDYSLTPVTISLPWPSVLSIIREFAPNQKKWGFRFKPLREAKTQIDEFVGQHRAVREARAAVPLRIAKE